MEATVRYQHQPDTGVHTFFKEGDADAVCKFLEELTSEHRLAMFTITVDDAESLEDLSWAGLRYRLEFGPRIDRRSSYVRRYV